MDSLIEYEIDVVTPVEYDSRPLGGLMSITPKKDGIDWKWLVTTFLALVAAVGVFYERLANIDKHIARVEMAVRIIGAKQGGDTKTLIDEALAVAKNASDAGRTESAKSVLDIANHLLAEQQASRVEVSQQFFDTTMTKYKQLKRSPELAQAAWEGTTKLAEYRSATTSVPLGTFVHIGEMSQKGNFRYLKDSVISGQNAIRIDAGCEGFDLDGWFLDNVVFQNVTICYNGRAAILNNVRFVNCKFSVEKSPKTEQLMEAAVKESVNVAIG